MPFQLLKLIYNPQFEKHKASLDLCSEEVCDIQYTSCISITFIKLNLQHMMLIFGNANVYVLMDHQTPCVCTEQNC